MGKRLSFASYAKCLQKAMKDPYKKQLKLAELLLEFLIMPDEEHEEYYAYGKGEQLIFVDKVMASNLFNGKENVHKNIQKNCDLDIVVNGVKGYFEEKILPFVSLHLKADMIEEMAEIINGDASIAEAKKKEFVKKAEENDSSGFLSSVFLYAVKKENLSNGGDKNNRGENPDIPDVNTQYYNSYVENLFLHKREGSKTVRLKDLFVMPMYEEVAFGEVTEAGNSVVHYISAFSMNVKDDEQHREDMLFIEGDAGVGKTSLVSYLSYLYIEKPEEWRYFFGSKALLCVRLRDIIPMGMKFSSDTIVRDILNYLKLESIDEFKKLYRDALVVLDGFDELCMVEGINENSHYYVYQIYKAFKGYKVLITTRPQYLYVDGLDFRKKHIILQHFDVSQRMKWVENYRATGVLDCEEYGIEYISDEENDEIDSICDTPMVMYMIVAGGIDEEAKHNKWALYHQIFYKELSDTEYNSMFENSTGIYSHGIKKHNELLYRLSAEISYKMFQSGNTKLFLTEQEILDIVHELKIEDIKLKEVAQHCYALCNYWKSNGKGAVEFYHNNIRDFFLCEKIFYEFNSIYQKFELLNIPEMVAYANEQIYNLFRYMKLPQKAAEFLYWRTKYNCEHHMTKDFPAKEYKRKYLEYIFSDMLTYGGISHYDRNCGENIYDNMINVLTNTVRIFKYILEPYLGMNECIKWFYEVDIINKAGILRRSFKEIFISSPLSPYDGAVALANKADFKGIYLNDIDLRHVDFMGSSLSKADFKRSIMKNSCLHNVDLRDAEMNNADLSHAKLRYADLRDADLRGTNLQDAELRDSNLSGADFGGADLSRADLRGAYLQGTNLKEADLKGADLRNARLEGVELKGAKLNGVDLTDTKLSGICLKGVKLRGAKLQGANLYGANLNRVDLRNADLRRADLRNANLVHADLRGTILPDGYMHDNQTMQIAHLKEMRISGLEIES